jgi:hypothetical protein
MTGVRAMHTNEGNKSYPAVTASREKSKLRNVGSIIRAINRVASGKAAAL